MVTPQIVKDAYNTSPLIQKAWPSFEKYFTYIEFLHRSTPQVQLAVFLEGTFVGGMNLAHTLDPQVGPAMTILHNYLMESHRGSRRLQAMLLRGAAEVCAEDEVKWLIIPHRRSVGVQMDIYKEITWESKS